MTNCAMLCLSLLAVLLVSAAGHGAAARGPGYEATEPIVFTKASCAVRSGFITYRSFSDPLAEVLLPTKYDKTKHYRTLYLLHAAGASEPCLRYLAALGLHDKHDLVCVSVGLFGPCGWTGLDVEDGHGGGRQAQYLIQAAVPLTGEREEVFVRVALETGKLEVLLTGTKVAISGYTPLAFEGRLLHGDASRFFVVGDSDKRELRPGPGPAANSTSCAYADGLLYFRTEPKNGDGRLVCYDLRARAAGKD